MEKEPVMNQEKDGISTDHLDSAVIAEKPLSHFGLVIGVLIIALALIFIGLYFWIQMENRAEATPLPKPERPTAAENNEPESTTAEAKTEVLDIVSTSDELRSIEADLGATKDIDVETTLNAIDAEFDAA